MLFPKLHFTFCTRAFPRPLEELMCCRVWKSWTLLVTVTFSPKVIQQNFTPNFCLANSIWEFPFLHLLTVLLVLPEVSLVWNLIVVKLYLSVISSNSFFITSETEQLFLFTGHLAIFSHQLLFCLFLKINLIVFLHYVAFFFSLSFMESSIVLNFQMLI